MINTTITIIIGLLVFYVICTIAQSTLQAALIAGFVGAITYRLLDGDLKL